MWGDSVDIDRIDRHILQILQHDTTISIQAIGDRVGLSHNACWRRIKRLEESGIIRKRVALVDAVVEAKFGSGGLYDPQAESASAFANHHELVSGVPRYSDALVQCVKDICNYIYETYGRFPSHVDAISTPSCWVQAHHLDLEFYDRFYKKLIAIVPLYDVSSSFAMEQVKYTTEVPV
jgi:Lrp/AsnC family transcriptional regulator